MKVDIDKIGPEGLQLDESLTSDWVDGMLAGAGDYRCLGDGHVQVLLTRMDDSVYVRGSAKVPLQATCSRCLAPVRLAVAAALDVTLVPKEAAPTSGEDGEVSEEDIGLSTYEENEIDLTRVVHDEVLLELPMQALCASDCAGLCTVCGKNLNEGMCGCEPQGDYRWDALRRIRLT